MSTNNNLILHNIGELVTMKGYSDKPKVGKQLNDIGVVDADSILIEDGKIKFIGNKNEIERKYKLTIDGTDNNDYKIIDVNEKVVMPGFVDSHTHLVFGGSREHEFEMKLEGYSYLDILKKGGGILSTVEKTRKASKEELTKRAKHYAKQMIKHGTTTIEIKSGYGLNPETEIKMLEVADELRKELPVNIATTYLGAHTIPTEYKKNRNDYIQQVIDTLPKVKHLAEFCDIFCEEGAFTVDESRKIFTEAQKLGFKIKIHAGQFNAMGGDVLAGEMKATSADHLDIISDEGIEKMKENGVIGVGLPGVPFHLMTGIYCPLRKMIDKGLPVAIATDFNPGSCPSYSMIEMINLACRMMKVSINEALSMSTINASHCLGMGNETGSIEEGKRADIIILDCDDHRTPFYHFGVNHVKMTIANGIVIET